MEYKLNKQAGALQEAMPVATRMRRGVPADDELPAQTQMAVARSIAAAPPAPPRADGASGLDRAGGRVRRGLFWATVDDGQRVLVIEKSGRMAVVSGPARIWVWGRRVEPMRHFVAHPGEFLMIRYRDGRQRHARGPSELWFDPREHLSVEKEDVLEIASKEAVVVYSQSAPGEVARRIVYGPAAFVPEPGEWLHTFSWHGAAGDGTTRKIPGALVFQKLWMMPDQMYHDVTDVRTADDAVLTIRLMIFFELVDVERMLATTHDPIGDFVNAASSDVVELVGKLGFEVFKTSTDALNRAETYRQLEARAAEGGYRINKVVFRGYGAPESLEEMHDKAIESRTRLQLERATEQQSQELEDFRLDRQLARAEKQREGERKSREAELTADAARRQFAREQARADAEQQAASERLRRAAEREHLEALHHLGVDLTRLLAEARPDRVIEVRGPGTPHVHLGE
ncbi:hypothetical protein L6R52_05800 [Myxococcota bacterium]|nr:hypothetical protein [Myxococcota bacterium]